MDEREKLVPVTGSMLRAARVFVGLSQEQVAERAEITRPCLAAWERSSGAYPHAHYPYLIRVVDVLEAAGARFKHSGVFIERATPISRTVIHSEAVA